MRNILLLVSTLALFSSIQAKADAMPVAKDFESLSSVVVTQTDEDTFTLQDLALSMGLSHDDFQTDFKKPTEQEREDLHMESYPIIMWRNPFVIPYHSPYANRYRRYVIEEDKEQH